jgi:hypothetical protein
MRLALGWLAAVSLVLSGCAVEGSGQAYLRSCVLEQDQVGTFDGKWTVAPIPVSVRAGQFSDAEKTIIRQAVQQWNSFTKVSLGREIFAVGSGGMPENSGARPDSICSSSTPVLLGGQFVSSIVIHKLGNWPYSADQAIAITSTCPVADTPLPRFYSGMIDLNYEFFFVSGRRQPDLQSIMVHELGHLAGLRHSCESSPDRAGVPSCTDSSLDPLYKSAVMYPVFGFDAFGNGEKRVRPNANDQGRFNCLYL